jgi:uncharacterized RDD family membrane protein YckC
VTAPEPPQPAGPDDGRAYAGIVTRTVAIAIDGGLLLVGSSITTAVIGLVLSVFFDVDTTNTTALVGALGSWTVLASLYFTLCWAAAGQTLGMRLMGLRVQRASGDPIRAWRAALRTLLLAAFVGPLFPGLLLVLVHPRRRAVHDLLAGTVVVYTDDASDARSASLGRATIASRG